MPDVARVQRVANVKACSIASCGPGSSAALRLGAPSLSLRDETQSIPAGSCRYRSWSDPGFVERWYPPKMPAGERLSWYAQHFDLVEVNSSFYAVPERRWSSAGAGARLTISLRRENAPAAFASCGNDENPCRPRCNGRRRGRRERKGGAERETGAGPARGNDRCGRAAARGGEVRRLSAPALAGLFPAQTPTRGAGRTARAHRRLSGWSWNCATATGWKASSWPGPWNFFGRATTTLSLVDAPNEKHFTIMPSELNEITNPRGRLSAFARTRSASLSARQDSGRALLLRLQRRRKSAK